MRVELAVEVFTTGTLARHEINAVAKLLEAFDEGRHDWVVDPDCVPGIDQYLRKHQPTLAGGYLSLAKMAMTQNAAWTGTSRAGTVVVVSLPELADHVSDLCRAAVVVVENVPGDERFLLTVIRAFRADRVQEALDRGWLEFRHGGGSSLSAVAVAEAARFRRSVRVVAVFDSDSLTPEHEGPNRPKARKLRDQRISTHVLLLREAENYAPYRVLAEIGGRSEASRKISELKRLIPRQRSHYDMKMGFTKQQKPEQEGFFDDLDDAARRALHRGFGDTVLEKMFQMRDRLSEADFEALNPDAATDLRTLLALIDSLI